MTSTRVVPCSYATAPSAASPRRTRRALARATFVIALLLATAAVYSPVVNHGFVSYDDPVYVSENSHVAGGLTPEGAAWALTASRGATWQPLVWLSFMADASWCGMKPGCFHGTNVCCTWPTWRCSSASHGSWAARA